MYQTPPFVIEKPCQTKITVSSILDDIHTWPQKTNPPKTFFPSKSLPENIKDFPMLI